MDRDGFVRDAAGSYIFLVWPVTSPASLNPSGLFSHSVDLDAEQPSKMCRWWGWSNISSLLAGLFFVTFRFHTGLFSFPRPRADSGRLTGSNQMAFDGSNYLRPRWQIGQCSLALPSTFLHRFSRPPRPDWTLTEIQNGQSWHVFVLLGQKILYFYWRAKKSLSFRCSLAFSLFLLLLLLLSFSDVIFWTQTQRVDILDPTWLANKVSALLRKITRVGSVGLHTRQEKLMTVMKK